MATPVIRSLTPADSNLLAGQSTNVTFDAYDPDARTVTFVGTATDSQGSKVTQRTTITWGDPLTFTLTADDPDVTVVQDPADPTRFTVTG